MVAVDETVRAVAAGLGAGPAQAIEVAAAAAARAAVAGVPVLGAAAGVTATTARTQVVPMSPVRRLQLPRPVLVRDVTVLAAAVTMTASRAPCRVRWAALVVGTEGRWEPTGSQRNGPPRRRT